MKGTFATILQKYYFHSGNRIVFRNGMCLTQMALEMWERLDFKEIDSSALSRVLKGERLFTCKQLTVFSRILKLNKLQKRELEEALMNDVSTRYGFHPQEDAVDMVSLLEKTIQKIEHFRQIGHSDMVVEWTEELHDYFRREIKQIDSDPQALHLYGDFIKLRMRSAMEARHSSRISIFVLQLAKELSTLGKQVGDEAFQNFANSHNAPLSYNQGDHHKSAKHFADSLKSKLELYDAIVFKRCLAISLVNVGKIRDYQVIKKELLEEIKDIPLHMQVESLEGLAKSEIEVGNLKSAEKLFTKAEQILDKHGKTSEYGVVREIQLTRTLLEGARKDKTFSSSQELEKRGLRALEYARIYGYERHANQIESLMKTVI